MSFDPGAMAEPMNEIKEEPTRMNFLAWKVSEAAEMTGPRTACTRDSELGTQVWVSGLSRALPMMDS